MVGLPDRVGGTPINASSRLLAALGAATTLAVAACSAPGTTTTGSSPSVLPVATSTPLPPPPPPSSPTGTIGGIDVAMAGQEPVLLRPGGDPVAFTVTLTNTTDADIPVTRFVVSFGHCICGHPGASIMPAGTMRMLDPATNAWVDAPYVVEGTGTDYLNGNLVPPFVVKARQTITYRLQARMEPDPDVTAGITRLTVTMETPDDRGHPAAIRVTVEPQA